MGSMQFLLPRREGLAQMAVKCGYLIGSDGAPWPTQVTVADHRLRVQRDARESGRFVTPWSIPGFGTFALSTATLLPREAPYHLALELCRGTLARLHQQFWARLREAPPIESVLRSAHEHFILAALQQEDVDASAREAETSLALCLDLIHQLLGQGPARDSGPAFSSRLTGFQVRGQHQLSRLATQKKWPGNAVFYQASWRETESNPGEFDWQAWRSGLTCARSARRRVVCGPLFRLQRHDLPDWLYLWDDDFDTLQSYLCSYIRTAVRELKNLVNVWYVTGGTNADSELHLGEEQRLRLTLAAIETLRQVDAQTPTLVGIKQPWGEYLGRSAADLSPLQFADILVRSDLGVSGFCLEMSLGCESGRTSPRDLLEFNRLLDEWSQLNLPLVIILSHPLAGKLDQAAVPWARYLQDVFHLLQQKSVVQGIIWGELVDSADWPAGLLSELGETKPLWSRLRTIWQPTAG